MKPFFAFLLCLIIFSLSAATLHIGPGQTYASLQAAAAVAQAGDELVMHQGTYNGGTFIDNLHGTAAAWITIRAAAGETVIIQGGTNGIQFSDPAYVRLSGLIFQGQTGNGLNTDDGGSYATPAHHVIFENCVFRNIAADGNNDLLKLSGLDDFEIRNCTFLNGAAGGSGIDMVGCHRGLIIGNRFENMGSNAIQAKGGSAHVRIEANFFKNCGQRTLNLGGSTGLEFFRPLNAPYEAADLQVYSNIIIGSVAAVAFVGSINVEVVNNTIYRPTRWVLRILQETVDPSRFAAAGDNTFRNNIVCVDNNLSTTTNIGPDTRPETFTFSHNLWHHVENANWSGPTLPVAEANGLVNVNPLFVNPAADDFHLSPNSPVAGKGLAVAQPTLDFYRQGFAKPPSIGAVEASPVTRVEEADKGFGDWQVFPNPGAGRLTVAYTLARAESIRIDLLDLGGRRWSLLPRTRQAPGEYHHEFAPLVPAGTYFVSLWIGDKMLRKSWIKANGNH